MVLGKVLQLHKPPCPSPGASRSVELKHSVKSSVPANRFLHSDIFFDRGFSEDILYFEHLADFRIVYLLHHFRSRRFVECPWSPPFLFLYPVH